MSAHLAGAFNQERLLLWNLRELLFAALLATTTTIYCHCFVIRQNLKVAHNVSIIQSTFWPLIIKQWQLVWFENIQGDSRHKTHEQKLLFFGCLYVYKDVGSLLQYIFICCIRCDWRCVSACLMSVSAPPVVIMDTGDRGFYYDLSVLRCQPLPLPLQTHSQPTTIMLH